jgi:hypothetical protein
MESMSAESMSTELLSRGKKIDVESGDLILEEPHRQEHWVIKRNMLGEIIDLYMVEADDELR